MSNNRRLAAALLGFFLSIFHLAAQVVDTVPPQLKCKAQPLMDVGTSICEADIYAFDLVASVTDDVSPTNSILLGVRKKCAGEGFPVGKSRLTFRITEIGLSEVEVWAQDQAGNTAKCLVQVIVLDNGGFCDPVFGGRAFFAKDSSSMEGVLLNVKRFGCAGDTSVRQGVTPHDHFGSYGIPGDLLWATASKADNPLNGVSTYDLSLIVRHILGLEQLSAPQIIAADANRDGKVTMYDVVLLRNLILGVIDELPGGVSWRFWPYEYEFPNPANPFSPPFPERIEVPRSADPVPNRFQFFGVKIGDVNFSAEVK